MELKEQSLQVFGEGGSISGIDDALKPAKIVEQIKLIQNVMSSVMKDGEHYGKIPGCGDKPTLLKPGAEKLCFTFRLAPTFDVQVIDLGRGHREYRIGCILKSINTDRIMGAGVGSASTLETKWRYRTGPVEFTGKPVPQEYWNLRKTEPQKAQELLGGKGFSTKKNPDTGAWEIAIQGEKVENENIADVYNTALKIAKKRAHVDATLTATAASDIFTQDIEEFEDVQIIETKPVTKPAPVAPPSGAAAEGTGTGVQPPLLPPPVPPSDDMDALISHLGELCVSLSVAANCPVGDILPTLTKSDDGKFKGFRDLSKIKQPWQAKKAIEKAEARLQELAILDAEDDGL